MSRVYLLGAGFSRAISGDMPMMKDLSAAVQAKVSDLPGASTPLARDFEQWLSYLVDTPPWLSQSDQLRNLAAFNDVARAVHSALDERQTAAVADELVMMGFSLPVTDLLVASMLTTNLSVDATITPVDYAAAVVDRVRDVFAIDHTNAHRLVGSFAGLGDDAIPRWVDTFANISP